MVVRFDLEHGGQAVADVDRAGVLAGALQHLRPVGRQRLQMHARALVAAVLRPHHREDAELGQVRLAAQKRDDALVFVRLQAVPFERWLIDVDHAASPPALLPATALDHRLEQHEAVGAAERRLARPLGVRHQPDDVARLVADAGDAATDPFGFAASVTLAGGVAVAEDDLPVRFELARSRRAARSSCLRRARSESAAPGPACAPP